MVLLVYPWVGGLVVGMAFGGSYLAGRWNVSNKATIFIVFSKIGTKKYSHIYNILISSILFLLKGEQKMSISTKNTIR